MTEIALKISPGRSCETTLNKGCWSLTLVSACLATGSRIFATGSDSISKIVLRSCGCLCLISGRTITVWKGLRSPKHIAIIAVLRSYYLNRFLHMLPFFPFERQRNKGKEGQHVQEKVSITRFCVKGPGTPHTHTPKMMVLRWTLQKHQVWTALSLKDLFSSGGLRARLRVWFQAVKMPIFGGFPLGGGTQLTRQLPQSSSKRSFLVRVRFGGVPSTVEEVVRVRFCLRFWKTNMGNTVLVRTFKHDPWSHKPALLDKRFGNCKVGGCKTLRQPFCCQPFANLPWGSSDLIFKIRSYFQTRSHFRTSLQAQKERSDLKNKELILEIRIAVASGFSATPYPGSGGPGPPGCLRALSRRTIYFHLINWV